jgi:hypothetical protein
VDEDIDPNEERRIIFGEESADSDEDNNNESGNDSLENYNDEEDENDEINLILCATRERKKLEAENSRAAFKDDLT